MNQVIFLLIDTWKGPDDKIIAEIPADQIVKIIGNDEGLYVTLKDGSTICASGHLEVKQ